MIWTASLCACVPLTAMSSANFTRLLRVEKVCSVAGPVRTAEQLEGLRFCTEVQSGLEIVGLPATAKDLAPLSWLTSIQGAVLVKPRV